MRGMSTLMSELPDPAHHSSYPTKREATIGAGSPGGEADPQVSSRRPSVTGGSGGGNPTVLRPGGVKEFLLAAILAVVMTAVLVTQASIAMAGDKVTICHATGSETNPYVLISPSAIGVKAGHIDHQHGEDIIPQFTITSGPHAGTYGPQGDQSILANGCVVPSPSPSPTESPSPTPTETPSPTPTPSESPKPSPSESPSPTPSETAESPSPTVSLIPPLLVTPGPDKGEPSSGGLAYTGAGSLLAWIIVALMAAGAGWATLRIGKRRGR